MGTFWLLHYSIADGIVTFQYILHLFWQSFTFEQEHIFLPSESSSSSSATTGAWYFAVTHHWQNVGLADFLKGPQVIILSCEVRSVGWIWRHCPSKICGGLCDAHACAWPNVPVEELPFRHFSYGTNSMKASIEIVVRVYCCLPTQEIHKNNTFIIQKDQPWFFSYFHPIVLTLHHWPHTIRFSPVPSSRGKKRPAMTPLCQWQGIAECCAPVAEEEGEQFY